MLTAISMDLTVDDEAHTYVLVYTVGAFRLRVEAPTVTAALRKMIDAIERIDEDD